MDQNSLSKRRGTDEKLLSSLFVNPVPFVAFLIWWTCCRLDRIVIASNAKEQRLHKSKTLLLSLSHFKEEQNANRGDKHKRQTVNLELFSSEINFVVMTVTSEDACGHI